eukprot:GILI01025400.1.p1 GENE.GILI01025400.1~~GILI01025400.1.p1  ORF type:complete len:249 (-),score=41.04 GILI01025400.1:80-826(-)
MSHGFVAVLISRLHDHLPLCAHSDSTYGDPQTVRTQQQRILERMKIPSGDGRGSEPSKQFTSFDHKEIVYFVLTDSYSDIAICAAVNKLLLQQAQKLACKLLDAVYDDFLAVVSREQIQQQGLRAFQFIKYDATLQKTINRITAAQSRANGLTTPGGVPVNHPANAPYDALKQEITDVHVVIRQNLDDLLTRGERLDVMSKYSDQLKNHSHKYYKSTVHMNRMRLVKTYGPPLAAILFVLLILWWRFF